MEPAQVPLPALPCRIRDAWSAEMPHASGIVRFLLRGLVTCFGPLISVEGAGRLAGLPEPVIFALNHTTTFECLAAPAALVWLRRGRMVHFLVDWMYLHLPGIGWLMRRSDPIPVYGKPQRWRLGERFRQRELQRPVLGACLERLAAGDSLGLFPEGKRSRSTASLLSGRSGLGEIVLRTTVPVVPVGLRFPAAERLGRPPRLGRIVVVIGEPLAFIEERNAVNQAAGLSADARRALALQVVARVMSEIARLTGKRLAAGPPEPVQPRLAAGGSAS